MFGRFLVQILAERQAVLQEVFMGVFSLFMQISGLYLKIGSDHFLPHPSNIITVKCSFDVI
jgi:hypothetical protein